jgi:hypothetical protein
MFLMLCVQDVHAHSYFTGSTWQSTCMGCQITARNPITATFGEYSCDNFAGPKMYLQTEMLRETSLADFEAFLKAARVFTWNTSWPPTTLTLAESEINISVTFDACNSDTRSSASLHSRLRRAREMGSKRKGRANVVLSSSSPVFQRQATAPHTLGSDVQAMGIFVLRQFCLKRNMSTANM